MGSGWCHGQEDQERRQMMAVVGRGCWCFPVTQSQLGSAGSVGTCCFHGALKLFELCASTPLRNAAPMEEHPNPGDTAAGKQGDPARVGMEQRETG